jgi:hypothetical protein
MVMLYVHILKIIILFAVKHIVNQAHSLVVMNRLNTYLGLITFFNLTHFVTALHYVMLLIMARMCLIICQLRLCLNCRKSLVVAIIQVTVWFRKPKRQT